ncbi:5-oxoprolinase subunit PxpA [Parageobacillus galactosidasius]|jgi:5-oxoprolinase (ATP-hydrolysing) subunit A|uniref:5-oxoprolinase subunit A n=1 Tax=Parageobacillus galactosidasius TaxID=883812 RepID=A0A226QI49_9BACL|nr:5-oxoprolinase subunit PxpA [Parageobacillus galactosidasius]OQP01191.1 lactam utilization protein LamB [Geobacillus sp. 44C]OXB92055.1 lactam utilization protein LamB [Parageobacillus galactosidasius]QNU34680.1 5-oxoprolinase subunit PxpA [Geobacillus sp. 44C]
MRVDLNCDFGESFGIYRLGEEKEILQYVTSVNVACGFHAGDPLVMRKTVQMALEQKVAIGAHPGFPDLLGFGRRNMAVTPEEVYAYVVYQIGALAAFVKAEGGKMAHVKPHGALYNMAAKDTALAEAIAKAVYDVDPTLILYGLAGSELIRAGKKIGLRTASEVFADRTYQQDGSLTPRSDPRALIVDEQEAVLQVLAMVKEKRVRSLQGIDVPIEAETICIHGDGKKAVLFAKRLYEALQKEGVDVCSIK